jgi:hypothetical protein
MLEHQRRMVWRNPEIFLDCDQDFKNFGSLLGFAPGPHLGCDADLRCKPELYVSRVRAALQSGLF